MSKRFIQRMNTFESVNCCPGGRKNRGNLSKRRNLDPPVKPQDDRDFFLESMVAIETLELME